MSAQKLSFTAMDMHITPATNRISPITNTTLSKYFISKQPAVTKSKPLTNVQQNPTFSERVRGTFVEEVLGAVLTSLTSILVSGMVGFAGVSVRVRV